jgi:tryptophanyl-tRNA synthetase
MTRVLSGIQPTGDIHIGNYIGAVRHWAADQHEHDSFFAVVDLHALSDEIQPELLTPKTLEVAAILLAAGLDPEVCTIFVQSHIHQHAELNWILGCIASMGQLRRMTQFKDKSARDGEGSASIGLFTYPVLQAADILLYDTDRVPVGSDQRQHLELARDLAQRFNDRFGANTLVVPDAAIPKVGGLIMDLQDPTRKMSKSRSSPQGKIFVLEPPESITKKIKRAVTDNETEVRYDPAKKPGVATLLELLAIATDSTPSQVADQYDQYGPLKSDTAAAVVEFLRPLQTRFKEISGDPAYVQDVLAAGAEKAEAVAAKTLARAQSAVGLLPRR